MERTVDAQALVTALSSDTVVDLNDDPGTLVEGARRGVGGGSDAALVRAVDECYCTAIRLGRVFVGRLNLGDAGRVVGVDVGGGEGCNAEGECHERD